MQPAPRSVFLIPTLIFSACAYGQVQVQPIAYEKETLANGLRVIYAPMRQAPVVHVRVLYHVGSRDERADRQGFAHLFEHMMFRGSAHVAPEEHMKLINVVGGNSNAFTSFDQTTYVNTIPSNHVEMALYLEADRMSSFKVDDTIFQTERKVVAEEWRLRYGNPPLGPIFLDFFKTAFTKHSYRWTAIGDMDQLRQSTSAELQEFFNKYYIPNNACLIVAGDIDVAQTKDWVKKYFGWIPKGAEIVREIPSEPEQAEPRQLIVHKPNVPLTNMYLGFKTTDYRSDDHYPLMLLGDILSSGSTGRLDRQFVNGQSPTCVSVGAGDYQLQDQAMFLVNATVQQGQDPEKVQADILSAVYAVATGGVTQDEVEKVRTQMRQDFIRSRQTCTQIATELGEEEVFGGNADRVNQHLAKLDAVKPADIQAVAKKYFLPNRLTAVHYRPDPTGVNARRAAAAAPAGDAPVVASSTPVTPRPITFPAGYPTKAPFNTNVIKATFNKGTEETINGIRVVTLTDRRLPLANISVVMPGGSDSEPLDKVGLGGLTAQMMRRGSAGIPFLEFSNDLEARGISIEPQDANDNTRLNISCTTDQLDYAVTRANLMLAKPDFPQAEFDKFRKQWIEGLLQTLNDPGSVANRDLFFALYPGSTLGRRTTPKSLESITLGDIKSWYEQFYQLEGAMVIVNGDVTPEQSRGLVAKLFAGFTRSKKPAAASYTSKELPAGRRIILVDNPEGRQATIRMAIRAYDINTDRKFAGTLAGNILSAGIESRLMKYVRAEKGLAYGCRAYFTPGRHAGEFTGSVDTNPETAGAAIEAMVKVFNDMKSADVTATELSEVKTRTTGGMVMETQTIAQQAGRRLDQILNGYPIDYWDQYPQKLSAVTVEQVRSIMNDFVVDDRMVIVVVGPASVVKTQLEKLGKVDVVPLPLKRDPAG